MRTVTVKKEAVFTDSWDWCLKYFKPGAKDIYFTEDYVKLYESDLDRSEAFVYREGESVFLFPYLKRTIDLLGGKYFDFETAYGYGGPLTNSPDGSFTERAVEEFCAQASARNIVSGMIRFHPLMDNKDIFGGRCRAIFDRRTVAMDLRLDNERLLSEEIHSSSCRRNISKGAKSGLRYRVDEKMEGMPEFVKIYRSTMKRIGAGEFYLFSDGYFNGIKALGKRACLVSVLLDDDTVAAAIILKSEEFGHYHLSGSLEGSADLKPNDFMVYNTALYLKGCGLKEFHLGGGSTRDPEDSLYQFKARFSKRPYSFYIGRMIIDEARYEEACAAWAGRYPALRDRYKDFVLKYRYRA
jgi:hypothetical protein